MYGGRSAGKRDMFFSLDRVVRFVWRTVRPLWRTVRDEKLSRAPIPVSSPHTAPFYFATSSSTMSPPHTRFLIYHVAASTRLGFLDSTKEKSNMMTTPTSGTPPSSTSMRTPAGAGMPTTPAAAAAAAAATPASSSRPNATMSLFGATRSSGSTAALGDQQESSLPINETNDR